VNAPARYTEIPRPVLWLVPEGEVEVDGVTHAVAPFYLSTLPVTNRQLEAWLADWRRSPLAPGDGDPAIDTSWEIASGYCRWYAALARKPIRLPTDAEWMHACLAGVDGAWLDAAARSRPPTSGAPESQRVPSLAATRSNPFGLHAMVGGVWEWVDGEAGPLLRGGCWRMAEAELSCSARRDAAAGQRVGEAGFRIARALRG